MGTPHSATRPRTLKYLQHRASVCTIRTPMRIAPLLIVTAATALTGCPTPVDAPGARGQTMPLHIKAPSYERRDVPRTPMKTDHVLELQDDCGNKCSYLQNSASSVMLHLSDHGVARAEDHGELVERVTAATGTTAQQTLWTRTWTGSWTEGADALEVVLKPDAVDCKRTTERGVVDQDCGKRRELRLRCKLVSLSIIRPRNTSARAWACRARGFRDAESITPLPWVFGTTDALVVLDGGNSHEPTRRYALQR